jgi:hypothetical protein
VARAATATAGALNHRGKQTLTDADFRRLLRTLGGAG